MNIVFSSIFDLTRVFWEVSRGLEKQGHKIYWITTAEPWTAWLTDQGVVRNNILQLVYCENDFIGKPERDKVLSEIVHCEQVNDITINQAMMMDRFILYKNKPDINEYMLLYYRDIKKYLISKSIHLVFAEPTNSNEVITSMICIELGVKFIAPWDMRFPRNRIIFNSGITQAEQVALEPQETYSAEAGKELINQFTEKQSTPYFFKKLSGEKVVTASKAAVVSVNRLKLLSTSSRNNLTHHDLSERIKTTIHRIVYSFYLKRIQKYDELETLTGRLAFYPLHVQPESSIDVKGSFYSDQMKLIKDIRRSLPFDTTLIIKEHPNFLGQRNRSFFKKIKRIPNVKLLAHNVSTFDIYKRIAILFTVTGTTAYEAGMLGIPAVTFVPMYFGGFSSVHHCGDITTMKTQIFKLLNHFERDIEADSRFMASMMNNSMGGFWTNPHFDPSVMADNNIKKLTKAFVSLVDAVSN